MSDASDLQHHLEEGLLLLTRGLVFEARESWRKALQIEPANSCAQDYLSSTECELNPYDRQRESEAARQNRAAPRPRSGQWEDDELEVIAAGPADDDDESPSLAGKDTSVTGFMMADDEADIEEPAARPVGNGAGTTGWVGVAEEDSAAEWGAEAVEAPSAEDEDEAVAQLAGAPGLTPPAAPVKSAAAGANGRAARPGAPQGGDSWEPLAWMDEDTPAASHPAVAAAAQSWADNAAAAMESRGRVEAPEPTRKRKPGPAAAPAGKGASGRGAAARVEGASGSAGAVNGQARDVDPRHAGQLFSELFSGEEAVPPTPAPLAPPAPAPAPTTDTLMEMATQALEQGRPEAARNLLLQLLQKQPGLTLATRYLEKAEHDLQGRYERILGHSDGVPMLSRALAELTNLDLDQVGGYILSRIDGILALDDIYTYALSAHIDRLTVMRILSELIESGIITIRR